MKFKDIANNLDLLNEIEWDMTPEDAVMRYLEWGNNPALGPNRVRSKEDYSTYFVINTWHQPVVYLMRRNSEDAKELAEFKMPPAIEKRFLESIGHNKGVYAIEGEVRDWLQSQLTEH
jgi:hypothetical protein